MKENRNKLSERFNENFPFEKKAESVKNKVWDNIDFEKDKKVHWLRIAAIALIFLLSATVVYLFSELKNAKESELSKTSEIKSKYQQEKQDKEFFQEQYLAIKKKSEEFEQNLQNEISQKTDTVFKYDTVEVFKTLTQPVYFTEVEYDTVYIEKESEIVEEKDRSIHYSSISLEINGDNNKYEKERRFRLPIRFGVFNNQDYEEVQPFAFRIKF